MKGAKLLLTILILYFSLGSLAEDSIETEISYNLKEVIVERVASRPPVNSLGDQININLQTIEDLPRFMGTVDPIKYLQTLPGVQTNNELSSGLSIHGCEDYQNYISINNAPIYYPNHLLGLFSTFTTDHFSSFNLEKSQHDASFADRLGGKVSLYTKRDGFGKWFVNTNIGLIESDITAGVEMAKGHNLILSARASYITLLYGKLLSIDNISFGYNFQDLNLTYAYTSDADNVTVTSFFDRDHFSLDGTVATIAGSILWGNLVAAINWKHNFSRGTLQTDAHFSGYNTNLNAGNSNISVATDANMASTGIVSRYSDTVKTGMIYSVGIEYQHQMALPISINAQNLKTTESTTTEQHSDEVALTADWKHRVCQWFEYDLGVRGSCFINKTKAFVNLDPRVTFVFNAGKSHIFNIHYGYYNQYLHKAGLTNGGLPTDFYFLSDDKFAPEAAHSVSASWTYNILDGKFGLSIETYFKQLYNVVTAKTDIFKLISSGFNYTNDIYTGNGRNYGMDIMFAKQTGIVTGYISYSLGRALRMYPAMGHTNYSCPANTERIHDLNLVVNAHFKKRWTVGLTFVLCSGTPYTRAECAYILNGSALIQYGDFNAANLPLYHRLDLSGSCDIIKNDKMQLTINLSIFNVYAYKNVQFYFYNDNFKEYTGSFLSTIIPSLSVYMKFW